MTTFTEEDTHLYTEDQIKGLLPTLWSIEAKLNPHVKPSDPEMPKGPKPNPAHSGDHMAHCADISRAWDRAFLTLRQKQVLLLRYGMAWTQDDVADHFDIAQQVAATHEARGIANIKKFLNGEESVKL